MRIAIDCRWISTDTGGIKQYTLNLVENLAGIDKENKYLLLFDQESTGEELSKEIDGAKNFSLYKVSYSPFSLKSQLFLPRILQKVKVASQVKK